MSTDIGYRVPRAPRVLEDMLGWTTYLNAYFEQVNLTRGETALASSPTAITAEAWGSAHTLITLILPTAGDYIIYGNVATDVETSAVVGNIQMRLLSGAAVVANSYRLGSDTEVLDVSVKDNTDIHNLVTVAGSTTLLLQAIRDSAGTYTTSNILSSATAGMTFLGYNKLV